MSVILHMTPASVVGLVTRPEIYVAAPYLAPMEAACKRLANQLKNLGCRSCRSKRVNVETAAVFQKVTDSFYRLLVKAKQEHKNLIPLGDFLSAASKNQASGIELDTSTGKQRILFGD